MAENAAESRMTSEGMPTDARGLVRRYRDALAEALEKLDGFGYRADADEVAGRHDLVYVAAKPDVLLSPRAVPVPERIFDEHTR